jgi:ATP-binding cassette subfamily B protein
VIITHRIFTLFDFDRILVLEDGMVKEQGRHEDLMALRGHYYELYRRQQDNESL